jgi:glucose-6-phosphate 1-dehydrogenase
MTDISSNSLVEEFDLIVCGGDGDLSMRKIFPALYHRVNENQITTQSRILAIARTEIEKEAFRTLVSEAIYANVEEVNKDSLEKLLSILEYFAEDATKPSGKEELAAWLGSSDNAIRAFYLATPATVFGAICAYLHERNLITDQTRVVLEKPLGRDLQSSEAVNDEVSKYLREDQIYRIDHYLGKETVQNLMVLRFANNLYERAWSANEIDSIQITVAESLGVGSRGGYYDNYGALRDMVQNHLLQLLCLIAMEPPLSLEADLVRDEKLKVLKALRPYTKESIATDTVKGQYTRGKTKDGFMSSYLEDIEKFQSNTETFVALKVYVDNWRWGGMPFYLRTGKRMPERYSEIVINFKPVPHNIFPGKKEIKNNSLTIRLQPEERIDLTQNIKIPGPGGYRYKPFSLELDYADHFKQRFPDAYERLLMDVVRGNQTLFMRRDEVKQSWNWVETILQNWKKSRVSNVLYESGGWGPGSKVMEPGHEWIRFRQLSKPGKD